MKKLLLGILIIHLTGRVHSEQDFSCYPEKDCAGMDSGSKVPDKNDCTRYYVCLGEGDFTPGSTPCRDGEYFSTEKADCEPGDACGVNKCVISSESCAIDCAEDGVKYIPVAGDCNEFIDCDDITHTAKSCPPNYPYFHGTGCGTDSSKCCTLCYHDCFAENIMIADPEDCHKYIFCFEKPEFASFECKPGYYFDVIAKKCIEETVPCSPYCLSNPGTGSGVCNEDFECPVNFGNYIVCDECVTAYYDCSSGTAVLADCATGELFDYTISECVPASDCPTFSRDSA